MARIVNHCQHGRKLKRFCSRLHLAHPCKERKDGAPSALIRASEIQSPGHPPRLRVQRLHQLLRLFLFPFGLPGVAPWTVTADVLAGFTFDSRSLYFARTVSSVSKPPTLIAPVWTSSSRLWK